MSFLASIEDALSGEPYDLLLAGDGAEARRLFAEQKIDLVVTDLRLPKVDGTELVAEISRSQRPVPCIVMTAFGTPELELRLERMGVIDFIDKPLEIGDLRQRILDGLEERSGDSLLRGLSVASFVQLLALEHKTCTVRIKQEGDSGMLFFRNGQLYDASHGEQTGLEAAMELVTWDQAEITVKNRCKVRSKRIELGLEILLLEAMRLDDEKRHVAASSPPRSVNGHEPHPHPTERTSTMALETYLKEFKDINGYLASGIMDFTGETLVTDSTSADIDLEATGAVFNDIFRSAHEASGKIGMEACQKMTIATPKGMIVMECSGVDAASHLHFIVALKADGNQALARKTLEKIIPKVVADMS
ncbi:MAG: response regulator [Acidobacteria bacterium]|nr:response regulator [Acidobacteriota bacterium]